MFWAIRRGGGGGGGGGGAVYDTKYEDFRVVLLYLDPDTFNIFIFQVVSPNVLDSFLDE